MEYAYGSHPGLCREVNEDRVGVFSLDGVFTVALLLDGMGGTNGGKIASHTAYDTMMTELELRLSFLLLDESIISNSRIGKILADSAQVANHAVYDLAVNDPSLRGMGTTLVAAVFYQNHCCIYNVGDSRGYYISDGQITQITKDQSYLQYLLDADRISENEAESFSERNVIMSAVGTEREVKGDLYYLNFTCEEDEYILLCSDGLHDAVSDTAICRWVSDTESLRKKIEMLIGAANDAGGKDNVSVALLCHKKVG